MSRKNAREVVFKIVFELIFQEDAEAKQLYSELIDSFENDYEITQEDEQYINDVLDGINLNKSSIDEKIKAHLKDWNFERLNLVDVAILRLSTYEICYRKDIPCKVSVNEAVELAKVFSDDSSPKFINGILAEIIKDEE